MDTTTQYKLNKYSKKVNDAYNKNNMSKVNEYMQHQFSYMNKYVEQQQGGDAAEIKRALDSIEKNVKELLQKTKQNQDMTRQLNEVFSILN
jgi:hemerythrin